MSTGRVQDKAQDNLYTWSALSPAARAMCGWDEGREEGLLVSVGIFPGRIFQRERWVGIGGGWGVEWGVGAKFTIASLTQKDFQVHGESSKQY